MDQSSPSLSASLPQVQDHEFSTQMDIQNDLLSGVQEEYYPNGSIHQRITLHAGQLSGLTEIFNIQNVKIESYHFKNGLLDGEVTTYTDAGQLRTSNTYKQGQLHGFSRQYINDILVIEQTYEHHLLHGCTTYYFPNGQAQTLMHYCHGLLDGEHTSYDEQGHKVYACSYHRGLKQGYEVTWSDQGHTFSKLLYIQGQLDGESIYFYPNGNIQKRTLFKMGKLLQTPVLYDIKGQELKG